MNQDTKNQQLVSLTTEIIVAYVGNNTINPPEVPNLISKVHKALEKAANNDNNQSKIKTIIPIEKSITPDYIICLEDGGKFKSLKRHLRTRYGLSPEQYKEKWGLRSDYPMVAPNYAEKRSKLAKKIHLGQKK